MLLSPEEFFVVREFDAAVGPARQVEDHSFVAPSLQVRHVLSNHDVEVAKDVCLESEHSVDALQEREVVGLLQVVDHGLDHLEELLLLGLGY